MNFSLNRYILNEALASNILRSILNEPSGFFKLSKIFLMANAGHETYDKAHDYEPSNGGPHALTVDMLKTVFNLAKTLNTLFKSDNSNMERIISGACNEGNSTRFDVGDPNESMISRKNFGAEIVEVTEDDLKTTEYSRLDDSELIRINKEYNIALGSLYSKAKNLMNRPDPALFFNIINRTDTADIKRGIRTENMFKDLSSITDGNFKKYTLPELKADKQAVSDLQDSEKPVFGFYFTAGGQFCGASGFGQVILYNPFIENDKNAADKGLTYYAKYVMSVFENPEYFFPLFILRTPLKSGRKLTWPVIYTNLGNTRYRMPEVFFNILQNGNTTPDEIQSQIFKKKQIGSGFVATNKVTEPASNLRQILNWGYVKGDYVYIMKPYGDLGGKMDFTKHRKALDTHRKKVQDPGPMNPLTSYKWEKDPLFRMQPYRVGSQKQYVTIYDKSSGTYRNVSVSKHQKISSLFLDDNSKIDVVYVSNPVDFVESASEYMQKRRYLFLGNKAIKAATDKVSANIVNLTQEIANQMKESELRATRVKEHLNEMTTAEKRLIRYLMFSDTYNSKDDIEKAVRAAGFDEEHTPSSQIWDISGDSVQSVINHAITGLANVKYTMELAVEKMANIDPLKYIPDNIDYTVDKVIKKIKDIESSITIDTSRITKQLAVVDEILARYE